MGNVGWATAAIAITVLALVPLGLASPAALETHAVITAVGTDGSLRGGYTPPTIVVDVAGRLVVSNVDPLSAHDLVAHDLGPTDNAWCSRYVGHHFCPLFASALVAPLGEDAAVEGTDQLVPGTTYEFFCSIHHWMTGTLVAI